jgi:hypothetical protein
MAVRLSALRTSRALLPRIIIILMVEEKLHLGVREQKVEINMWLDCSMIASCRAALLIICWLVMQFVGDYITLAWFRGNLHCVEDIRSDVLAELRH